MAAFPWTSQHAFGMPKHTVRAIMTLSVLFTYEAALLMGLVPVPKMFEEIVLGSLFLYVGPRTLRDLGGQTLLKIAGDVLKRVPTKP